MLTLQDNSHWRKYRESQDLRSNLSKLVNPASDHDRVAWKSRDLDDEKLEELPNQISNNNNFEDYLCFCALISMKANIVSFPGETNNVYHVKKIIEKT